MGDFISSMKGIADTVNGFAGQIGGVVNGVKSFTSGFMGKSAPGPAAAGAGGSLFGLPAQVAPSGGTPATSSPLETTLGDVTKAAKGGGWKIAAGAAGVGLLVKLLKGR